MTIDSGVLVSARHSCPGECYVSFNSDSWTTCNVSISKDHDDKRALKVADELGRLLRECRSPYSPLTRISGGAALMIGLLLCLTPLEWWSFFKTGHLAAASGPLSWELLLFLLPLIAVGIVLAGYVERGWKWMFPKLWFSIGRQSREFDKRSNVRKVVFGVILLEIVVNIVANLLSIPLTKS